LFGGLKGAYYDGTCMLILHSNDDRCLRTPASFAIRSYCRVQHLAAWSPLASMLSVSRGRPCPSHTAWPISLGLHVLLYLFSSLVMHCCLAIACLQCHARFSVRWSGAVFPNYAGTGQVQKSVFVALAAMPLNSQCRYTRFKRAPQRVVMKGCDYGWMGSC